VSDQPLSPSARKVLVDILALPAAEQAPLLLAALQATPEPSLRQVIDHLEYRRDWMLGYVLMDVATVELLISSSKRNLDWAEQNGQLLVEMSNQAWRRTACDRAKQEQTAALDDAIADAMKKGKTKPREVLAYLRDHNGHLVSGISDAKGMMRRYRNRHPKP
jgi:hypothetical protein